VHYIMVDIEKLANAFDGAANTDIFGDVSWKEESQKLHHLAGKMLYKSNRDGNKRLREAGELLLRVSDLLKAV